MSDLLQQAIVDATALKEAAIKNAENTLIEKYSQEFKDTVQKLLEQEEVAPAPADAAVTTPTPNDAIAPDINAVDVAPDLSADTVDPMVGGLETSGDADKKDAFSKVPGAFSNVSDDEMITINFDQIRATLNEMLDEKYDAVSSEYMTGDALDKGGNPTMKVVVKGSKNSVTEKWEQEELEEVELMDEEQLAQQVPVQQQQLALNQTANSEEDKALADVLTKAGVVADKQHLTSLKGALKSGAEELQKLPWFVKVAPFLVAAMPVISKLISEQELEEADGQQLSSPEVVKATQDVATAQGALAQKQKTLGDKQVEDAKKKAAAAQQAASAAVPTAMEEEIELTEEELTELAEELNVDLKIGNLSDGYMGSTETQKREQRNVELAAARDEAAAKEREEEVEKMKDLMQENTKVKDLNSQLLNAVENLKEQLEKINLSNAKLLYTNKALGNISLNERQKSQIVESISKADSVLAAKTIYETLQNAVDTVAKEKEAPQSLREALNRAPSPFAVKKSSANSVNDLMADRMKALAGIKKQ